MTRQIMALGATFMLLAIGAAPASADRSDRPKRGQNSLEAAASWHGRPIQRPQLSVRAQTTAGYPQGWTAGAVRRGSGYARAGGSERVRRVQRSLSRLGYRPGPVDGLLGPRTAAAIRAFEGKHGLERDGVVDAATLDSLRARLTPPAAATAPAPAPGPAAASPAIPAPQAPDSTSSLSSPISTLALLLLGFVSLLAVGYVVRRRWWRQTDAPIAQPMPQPVGRLSAAAWLPPRGPRALGYVRLARGAPSASFHAQAAAIETGCLARGMTLVSLVSDIEPDSRAAWQPPSLTFALDRLGSGDVDRLVVSRLDHVARTGEDLRRLFESIAEHKAALVVLDRDLDTALLPDPAAAEHLLRHDPGPPTPLPEAADTHAIDAHIASMLDEGLSHRDIAAALNDEPIPPPEGRRWGLGGVEASLRRRRRENSEQIERSDA